MEKSAVAKLDTVYAALEAAADCEDDASQGASLRRTLEAYLGGASTAAEALDLSRVITREPPRDLRRDVRELLTHRSGGKAGGAGCMSARARGEGAARTRVARVSGGGVAKESSLGEARKRRFRRHRRDGVGGTHGDARGEAMKAGEGGAVGRGAFRDETSAFAERRDVFFTATNVVDYLMYNRRVGTRETSSRVSRKKRGVVIAPIESIG